MLYYRKTGHFSRSSKKQGNFILHLCAFCLSELDEVFFFDLRIIVTVILVIVGIEGMCIFLLHWFAIHVDRINFKCAKVFRQMIVDSIKIHPFLLF